MRTKVIIGKDTIENYDKLIEQLRSDPTLKQVADEMTEAYHKKWKASNLQIPFMREAKR